MSRKKDFKRRGASRRKRIDYSWRKPKGPHSKLRKEIKGAGKLPKPGYGREKGKRGLHPSGYKPVLVHNPKELNKIDKENEAARISSRVGLRKKKKMVKKALDLGIEILNLSEPEKWLEKIEGGKKKKERKGKEEEKVECPVCGKKFKTEKGMKVHKGKVH